MGHMLRMGFLRMAGAGKLYDGISPARMRAIPIGDTRLFHGASYIRKV